MLDRLLARDERRHRGLGRLLGQPVAAHAGRRHGRLDDQHQSARPAVHSRWARRCSTWCRIRSLATQRSGNLSNSPTIARGQLLRPFPQFTDVLAHRVSEVRTRYDALTLRFDRRIRDNWGVNANYTFSRLMDNQFGESNTYAQRNNAALDNYDLDREWGYSLLDVPHRVNVNGTFVLPIGAGHRWLTDGLGNACSAAGRSAPPRVSAMISGQRLAVHEQLGLLGSSQRPNIVPGVELATSGTLEERLTNWINLAAFTPAPAYTFGNAPRTLPDLRTPGQRNVDLSVQKTQPSQAPKRSR